MISRSYPTSPRLRTGRASRRLKIHGWEINCKRPDFPCCRVWLPEGNTQRYVQSDQRGESPEVSFRNSRSFWVRIKLRDSPLWICCRTSLKNLIQLLLHVAAAFWRCRSMGWRIFGAKIRSDYENTKTCGMESGLSFGDRDFLTTVPVETLQCQKGTCAFKMI